MKKFFVTLVYCSVLLVAQLGLAALPEDCSSAGFFVADTAEGDRPEFLPCVGRISSTFGPRRVGRRRHRMHKGIDIAAPVGTPIMAPADGTVAFVGRKGAYGLTVVIEHQGELSTLYAHNSKILVEEGDQVKRGQEISRVGNTGRSTGPHLHYEVRINEEPVDPTEFI